MTRGVNKVFIIGNLGADPEVRYMPNGSAVVNISVATTDSWKDKKSGELQLRTEWHRIVLYNRIGEIANDYLKKGSKVYIEGFLRTNRWQDKNGEEKYTIDIIANNMQLLDSKESNSNLSNKRGNTTEGKKETKNDTFDDDIPF